MWVLLKANVMTGLDVGDFSRLSEERWGGAEVGKESQLEFPGGAVPS